MAAIATLGLAERLMIDRERLAVLVRDLGEKGAEHVVARALEEISFSLLAVETSWAEGDCARIARLARSLTAIADEVGLHLLAHVACDVGSLARSDDAPGLAATVARLQRVGEGSMLAIWTAGDINF